MSIRNVAAPLLIAVCAAVASPTPAFAEPQCDNTFFFTSQALCQQQNKLCGHSRNRQGCWSPVESFAVDGRTTRQNPVIFKMPANITVYVQRIDNRICLEPSCSFTADSRGIPGSACNALPDCDVPDSCARNTYGALMRNDCNTPVMVGSFPSGDGRHVFFISQDGNSANNAQAFRVKVSY